MIHKQRRQLDGDEPQDDGLDLAIAVGTIAGSAAGILALLGVVALLHYLGVW